MNVTAQRSIQDLTLSFSTPNHFSKHLATRVVIDSVQQGWLHSFWNAISPKATCPFAFYINVLKWDKPFSKRQSDHAFWFITNYLFCLYFWRWRPSVQITLSTWLTMLNYPKKLNSYVHKEDWSICDFLSPSAGRKKTKKYMRPSSR